MSVDGGCVVCVRCFLRRLDDHHDERQIELGHDSLDHRYVAEVKGLEATVLDSVKLVPIKAHC